MKIKDILIEFIEIANVCEDNLCVTIRGTDHSKERSEERHVPNSSVIEMIKTAIPLFNSEIHHPEVKKQIFSQVGKYYHIQKVDNNIVGALKYDNDYHKFFFFLVTVVKRNSFYVRPGTTQIKL